jgi:hypothetical protein
MSMTLMTVSSPSTAPSTMAATRRARAGNASSSANAASASSGMRTKAAGTDAPGGSRVIWLGTTRARKTRTAARTVSTAAVTRRRRKRVKNDNPTILTQPRWSPLTTANCTHRR